MKMTVITKASLALSILATGTITSTHQTVNATEHEAKYENVTKDIFDLRDYYNGESKQLKNVIGYHYSKGGRHYLIFDKNRKFTRIQIFGKDIERFKARKNPGLDIFIVKESENSNGTVYSYGGVTKKNQDAYYDYLNAPKFVVNKEVGKGVYKHIKRHYIYKEEISLKELDFKLRQYLIQNFDLYKKFPKDSKIKVIMKDGGYYTFELNKKLQTNRMSDVIDGRNIEKIEANIR
ncbi:superantigen-like protein SSL5 [Staphylococcus aureus]|uniref:superantigen-like protein SSL5 n=1 Tax=Staphylococcus aureus TaxID=1280 RepID=UPI000DA2ED5E|nr:superantigen-like protein SSL5 [Staphylococcus aureus]MBW5880459.1 superantigen-like protein SSL5 [Staphylococcus aureus]MBW5882721.1 superantigen-like protein SSL5 [Staphylococcus aureus]MCQ1427706.1 superantigen-like protein SSL5 [Staphylococcus aureus]NDP98170.1 superantigen-like protein SSL5 [Staphylococcus aureus]NDR16813.1 superantigen-like protein SSL5 [Staphylococcus aureus]